MSGKPIVVRRKVVKPQLKRDKLPIANYEHDFIKRLEREKILVVEASTGSGKSTQLPQYVAKSDLFQGERRKALTEIRYGGSKSPLGLPSQGKIVVSTQPNAFAAAAVATRVGYEYDDDHLGRKVGLITPTESKFDPTQCEILFVSDSELVRIMTQDRLLSRVGVLIIDEAHERTLYTDVIMTLAKEIKEQRDDFYIVISSATIEVKRFLSFMFNLEDSFGGAPNAIQFDSSRTQPVSSRSALGFRPTPLTVLGKTYEVAVTYDPLETRDPTQEKDPYLAQILTPKLAQVLRRYLNPAIKGHALVFVEDTHTVLRVVHHLRRFLRMQTKLVQDQGLDPTSMSHNRLTSQNTRVIPLYLSMPLSEQQRIMDFVRSFQGNKDIRYVFVADNVAETSITLPDVKLVIDTGRMMVSHYDMMRRLMVTEETFVSKDRASQRQGRTGRTSPGLCVRLYNETDLKLDRVEPDIKRVALDKVALQLAAMDINPKALRLIEPPEDHKFIFALEQLVHYECLISNAQNDFASHLEITNKGRVFVQLPFAPDTCEQLWQASLISAEATTIMHCISCLFNNESSNIFEHSPGLTWKALAEQIIDDRSFDISPQVGIRNNLLTSQHWTAQQYQQQQQIESAAKAVITSDRHGRTTPNTNSNDSNALKLPGLNKQTSVTYNPLLNNPNPLVIQHNTEMTDKGTLPPSRQDPHLWYNPFWQTNPSLKFGFNLNSGSDLELGYLMYLLLMHYEKPGCATCTRRFGSTTNKDINKEQSAPIEDEILLPAQEGAVEGETAVGQDDSSAPVNIDSEQFSITTRRQGGALADELGIDDQEDDSSERAAALQSTNTNYKRCELCPECESDFAAVYKVLPTAIKQAENFIRSTRDLVHKSLCRNYSTTDPNTITTPGAQKASQNDQGVVLSSSFKQHPANYPPTRIMTHCIYTALSHMAGIVLVNDHLAEGVVLPHKYFKMVKAAIDPNACSNTVDTYYKLVTVPNKQIKKTRYTCVKNFIVVHVTARKAHDYNITCLHPFELSELLPLAQEAFKQNISSLQLLRVIQYAHIGRGLYSSVDYVLSNQRIDNMARQYELEKNHLRQQQLQAKGNMMAHRVDDGESTRNMEAMNWSRFAAIPFREGTMDVHTLLRYNDETIRRIEEIIMTASRHMQHLYERERRSYRLPLSNIMFADINLSHDYSIKEIIIHADGKSFAIRPADIQANVRSRTAGTAGAAPKSSIFGSSAGRALGTKSTQQKQIGLNSPVTPGVVEEDASLVAEFGSNANVAAVSTDVRDIEQHWMQQQQYNDDEYAAALAGGDDDDDIEMLDDDDDGDIIMLPSDGTDTAPGTTNTASNAASPLQQPSLGRQPSLLQQRSLDRLPSGQGISYTYSQSNDRQRNDVKLGTQYDALQITRFPQAQWCKHDEKKTYTNTLSLRKRVDFDAKEILVRLATVWDIEHNVRGAQDHFEEDLLKSISPVREIYHDLHHAFEAIVKSLQVLHKYQYFPLIPEFADYSQTVNNIYDQSTALVKFNGSVDEKLRSLFEQYAAYNDDTDDYFIASLLDVQQFFNLMINFIEKYMKQNNYEKPHQIFKEISAIFDFKFSIFVSIHFELGPRDLISWIQLAPNADALFDLSLGSGKGISLDSMDSQLKDKRKALAFEKENPVVECGLRRFIAPSETRLRLLSDPIYDDKGNDQREDFVSRGYLVDQADLRLLQISEEEISNFFSSTLRIGTFDCLYTISATVDHSEIIDVHEALRQIEKTYKGFLGAKRYQIEILERVEFVVNDNAGTCLKPHTRTQITFAGNQTSVLQSVHTLLKMSEPTTIPVGPLTNSTNAFLQFLVLTGQFPTLVGKYNVAAEYIRHGSDGTVSVWGSADRVFALDKELQRLVAIFEKRRQVYPLPHNIFADLKNDNENSPYYSAYQLLIHQINRITNNTAKYELKTDETAFVLETTDPAHLSRCSQAILGFKSKCSIEDDLKQVPCFICLQTTSIVQRLSTCDHPICSLCLYNHADNMISRQRQRVMELEQEKQDAIRAKLEANGQRSDDISVGGIARSGVTEEHYLESQQEDQSKLLSQLRTSYDILCPCYQSRRYDGTEYYINLAAQAGVKRKEPTPREMTFGRGCEFAILPSDIARICTPSQIHNILFLLAKPVLKATNTYLPCPSASCNTLLTLLPWYQQCPRCNVGVCTQCNVTNSSLHQLVPCHIFKGILAYHDEVGSLFREDNSKLINQAIAAQKGKKDGQLGKYLSIGSMSNSLLRPYLDQEIQTRISICTLLQQHAQKWLKDDWLKHSFNNAALVDVVPDLYINPGIFFQCGSYIRFLRGVKETYGKIPAYHSIFNKTRGVPLDYDTKTHYAIFNQLLSHSGANLAYHGTPNPANVPLIMHNGLDPKFRAGQAYGPGEYLGISPSVSYDYGREFFLIVLFLNKDGLYTTEHNFCYVIKNPIDFKSAYCIPLGVVRVSKTSTRIALPAYTNPLSLDVPGLKTSSSAWFTHLGFDESGQLAGEFYKEEKLKDVIGVALPKESHTIGLDNFKHRFQVWTPNIEDYAGKALVKMAKDTGGLGKLF